MIERFLLEDFSPLDNHELLHVLSLQQSLNIKHE